MQVELVGGEGETGFRGPLSRIHQSIVSNQIFSSGFSAAGLWFSGLGGEGGDGVRGSPSISYLYISFKLSCCR